MRRGPLTVREALAQALGANVEFGARALSEAERGEVRFQDQTGAIVVELGSTTELAPGDLVVVSGERTARGVRATKTVVVGRPGESFARASSDFSRLSTNAAHLDQCRALLQELRAFFDGEGFVEVNTPSIVPSPGMDLHLAAYEVPRAGYLATSPEYQMKRLLSAGYARIFQLCKSFRQDESGSRHEREFTMLEWYRAFCDVESVMQDTEELTHALALSVTGDAILHWQGEYINTTPPWPRLRVEDAFRIYAGREATSLLGDETEFFRVLAEEIEPQLGKEKPVFLVDWPAQMASLARLKPGDPRWAERFEAYVAGVELCNGFGELTDPKEQRARFEKDQRHRREQGLPVYPVDEAFLQALADGMPPSAGNALGVDRLLMMLTGARHIEETLLFPARTLER